MMEQPVPDRDAGPEREPVWSFRGYELGAADFTGAMIQLYRGELQRANTWRTRLDSTTYWTVVTSLVAILYLFTGPQHHHVVALLATLMITLFLWIEARRYRYYELWSYRVRLMETDFLAAMLVPPFQPHAGWAETLAETLLMPRFPVSAWEAFGRRFRRNYMAFYIMLGIAWALKGYLYPEPAVSWAGLMGRFALGAIPGEIVVAAGIVFNAVLVAIGLLTSGMKHAAGEVLPKHVEFPIIGGLWDALADRRDLPASPAGQTGTGPPLRKRTQLLTIIVTARPQVVAERVMNEMRRGVTSLQGKGVYTQQDREVLMIALTVTEIGHLEQIVRGEDPNAFVVVLPAQEVIGRGFQPMTE